MTITEQLQRLIAEGERNGVRSAQLNISDKAAREFAGELESLQLTPDTNRATIYAGLKAGTSKFMGLPVIVAAAEMTIAEKVRAYWSRFLVIYFGKSVGLNQRERSQELGHMRREHPEMFNDDGTMK